MSPQQIFDAKWPNVEKIVKFRARRRLSPEDREDMLQLAGIALWLQAMRGITNINCGIIATDAYNRLQHQRTGYSGKAIRPTVRIDSTHASHPPARETSIRMGHGVVYTATDAVIDAPELLIPIGATVTMEAVAAAMGVSRQRVHQLKEKLGAVKVDRAWHFPLSALEWVRERRSAREELAANGRS